MNITSQDSVLTALEHQANWYRCHRKLGDIGDCTVLAAAAIDKTGTVDASYLLHNDSENNEQLALIEQQERNRVRELGIVDKVLQVHGTPPSSKGKGIVQLVYENVNGLSNKLSDNEKVEKAKEKHDELEVDIAVYNKHSLNMRHRRNVNSFNQLFKGGEAAIQLVVAHNIHKDISRVQEGGTSLLLFGTLTDQLDHNQRGKDEMGLGRWLVMMLKGDGVTMQVVCGYNPCFNRNPDSNTTYQQHRQFFITQKKDLTCPCKKIREDLVGQLKQWREDGDQLIICLNANKNIYKKSIGKALTDIKELAMKEVVGEFTRQPVGPTFFRGSKPINGIWATSDITISNACIMPAGYGLGDHCMFVIDFNAKDIIGQAPPRVIQATLRRLNTRIPRVANKYVRILEEKVLRHRLIERMGAVHTSSKSHQKLTKRINRIDRELGQYMRNAEKKCQKKSQTKSPFHQRHLCGSSGLKCTNCY
jgi:hypothetical protein